MTFLMADNCFLIGTISRGRLEERLNLVRSIHLRSMQEGDAADPGYESNAP